MPLACTCIYIWLYTGWTSCHVMMKTPSQTLVEAGAVVHAIPSSPTRSAGGLDYLHPQHLKDILQELNFLLILFFGDGRLSG